MKWVGMAGKEEENKNCFNTIMMVMMFTELNFAFFFL
jgi:hypothetical protein